MAVKVRRVTLWRADVEDRSGALAGALEPLAHAGTDLKVVMGYGYPDQSGRGVIEIYPVAGKRAAAGARAGGFAASSTPVLLVEGDNHPALAYAVANAIAFAGVNIRFFVAQVVGDQYSALVGFRSDADARKSAAIIRRAVSTRVK